MAKNNWTREETIVAFNVYCKIPFKNSSKNHPTIIKYASIIGRSASALNMKVGNIGRLDPELKKKGIFGLAHGSKVEEDVWDEFNGNWDKLAYESEKIISQYEGKNLEDEIGENEIWPEGKVKERIVKARVNQSFFRSSVLSSYNSKCCITGLCLPELLVASHIIPWNKGVERTNPRNGLCLNHFHDKAFDKGLITINTNYKIKVSASLRENDNKFVTENLFQIDGKEIELPNKFLPKKEFLRYHNKNIFINEV